MHSSTTILIIHSCIQQVKWNELCSCHRIFRWLQRPVLNFTKRAQSNLIYLEIHRIIFEKLNISCCLCLYDIKDHKHDISAFFIEFPQRFLLQLLHLDCYW